MRVCLRVLFVLLLGSSSAWAQNPDLTGKVAYVADKSCPFSRGENQPGGESLVKDLTTTVDAIAQKCAPLKVQAQAVSRLLADLADQAGFTHLASPGTATPGYRALEVTCASYPFVFDQEYRAMREAVQQNEAELPSEEYAKNCKVTPGEDRFACLDKIFAGKMRKKAHECLTAKKANDWENQRKAMTDLAGKTTTALVALTEGISKVDLNACNGIGPELVDSALTLLGSVGLLAPGLAPYGAAVAVGAEGLRALFNRFQKSFANKGGVEYLKRMETLRKLACLYGDGKNAAFHCEKVLATNSKVQPPAPGRIPRESKEYFDKINSLGKLVDRMRAAAGGKDKVPENLMTDFVTAMRAKSGEVRAPGGTYKQGGFYPATTMKEYLKKAAAELKEYKYPYDVPGFNDGRDYLVREREVRKQGAQLEELVKAFEAFEKDDDGEKALMAALQIPPPADDKKAIPLDFLESLSHTWERLDPNLQLSRLANDVILAPATRNPKSAEMTALQGQINGGYTVLLGEMRKLRDDYFNVEAYAAAMKKKTDAEKEALKMKKAPPKRELTELENEWVTKTEPLLMACALLPGLYLLPEKLTKTQNATDELKSDTFLNDLQFWEADDRKEYYNRCKMFQCNGNLGLTRYQSFSKGDISLYKFAECSTSRNFENARLWFRKNYLEAKGVPCGKFGEDTTGPHFGR